MLGLAINQIKDISITMLSIHGEFLYWNTGARLLDGYESDEIIGKPLDTLHPLTEQRENLSEYLLSAAKREGRVKQIGRRLKKDGTIYLASVVFNTILDETGKHVGYIRVARELNSNEID